MQEQSTNQLVDRLFKERLDAFESGYSPRVWENVSAQIGGQRRRHFPFFWLVFFGSILGATWLILTPRNPAPLSTAAAPTERTVAADLPMGTESSMIAVSADSHASLDPSNDENPTKPTSSSVAPAEADVQRNNVRPTTLFDDVDNLRLTAPPSMAQFKGVRSSAEIEERVARPSVMAPTLLNSHVASTLSAQNRSIAIDFDRKTNPTDCPDFSSTNKGFSVDLYYSSDYPIRSFSARNVEFQAYQAARERWEDVRYSFSAGARISYNISPSFALRAGLNYSQINERFSYQDPEAQQIRTVITIDTIFSGGEIVDITMDTTFIQVSGLEEVQSYNRYKFIDIPIIAAYEIPGHKYDIAINGGVYLNLLFRQKGQFLNPALDIATFTSGHPQQYSAYKMNAGLSLYGSVSFAYKFTPRVSLLVEPHVRHFLNPLSLTTYPLKQQYTNVGLMTGVRLKF